ncbi:MAG: hypothetical protein JXR37_22905 [Kiritimatiellae bacterium]|nr:hypothetical protein [Kiritimatiellia bacterium]
MNSLTQPGKRLVGSLALQLHENLAMEGERLPAESPAEADPREPLGTGYVAVLASGYTEDFA